MYDRAIKPVQGRPFSRLRDHVRHLSLTPFDVSSADGRARERHRRVALSAGAAALAKVLSVGTALISVPLTLHYLGAERFGMWMIISSLIALLAFADLGIANGVLSEVAAAHGRDDRAAVQRIVSSGFFLLSAIAVALLALFAGAYFWVPWHRVFNVQSELARAEAGPALAVFVACFAAAIPLAVVQRVQLGLQQGFTASLWQCVGSLCGLAGVLLAISLQGGLPWLVLSMAGVPLLAALLNSLHFYGSAQPDLRPRLAFISRQAARRVAGSGALFFVLQVTVALAYTSDSLVIAQLLGAPAVAAYAVPEKLFSLISLALAMVLAPLWPAYGEAIARGDGAWVRRTLKHSIWLAAGVAGAGSLLLLAFGPAILHLWVGEAIAPPMLLLVALAVWKVMEAMGSAVAMFLNGARVVTLQVVVASTTALAAIGLKFLLVPSVGIAGAVWATVIAYVIFAAIPYTIYLPKLARNRVNAGSAS